MSGEVLQDPFLRDVPTIDGRKVLDSCVLFERIGQGGMGAVYRGRHQMLDIDVAVKCLLPSFSSGNEEMVARFEREARLAARLNHSNIIRVFDINRRHGLHYIVMEYVCGETARERVVRKGRALPLGEAVWIVLEAARGLAAVHEAGIVHRDIKPDNILISTRGEVKLADLGLGRLREETLSSGQLTHSGIAMGTPRYMPPEQWNGLLNVGKPGDVWAMGATLHFLLAGRDAYEGSSLADIMRSVCLEEFPRLKVEGAPGELPPELFRILEQCTEREPDRRFASAVELVAGLEALVDEHGLQGSLSLPAESVGKTSAAVVSPPPRVVDRELTPAPTQAGHADESSVPRTKGARQGRRLWLTALASLGCITIGIVAGSLLTSRFQPRALELPLASASQSSAAAQPEQPEPIEQPKAPEAPAATAPLAKQPEMESKRDPKPPEEPLTAPASPPHIAEPVESAPPLTPAVSTQEPAPATSSVQGTAEAPVAPEEASEPVSVSGADQGPVSAPAPTPPAPRPEIEPRPIPGFTHLARNPQGTHEYRHDATGIVMVLIPGGSCLLGSTEAERNAVIAEVERAEPDPRARELLLGGLRLELGRRETQLPPFLIAKQEVRQSIWRKLMGFVPARAPGDDLPVDNASWDDAKEFCRRASLALPTEAQWEVACRANTTSLYSFGDFIDSTRANCRSAMPTTAAASPTSGPPSTGPLNVETGAPNAFGLQHMHGNVAEWCEDAVSPATRALRGGGWTSPAWACRSASRDGALPDRRRQPRGVRPVFVPGW